jgi:hypothetical protein
LARRSPTLRGNVCVPPPPGMIPSLTSGSAKRDLAAAAEGDTVDGTHQWQRTGKDRAHHTLEDQMLQPPLGIRHAVALLEIAARAERLVARPRQDDAAQRPMIHGERFETGDEILAHLGVEGIERLRAVQGDPQDIVGRFRDIERFVAFHGRLASEDESSAAMPPSQASSEGWMASALPCA